MQDPGRLDPGFCLAEADFSIFLLTGARRSWVATKRVPLMFLTTVSVSVC